MKIEINNRVLKIAPTNIGFMKQPNNVLKSIRNLAVQNLAAKNRFYETLKVAQVFGKQHKNIMQAIRNILGSAENSAHRNNDD